MLFSSYGFLFAFLPLVLLGLWASDRVGGRRAAFFWLSLMSLIFYAAWDVRYLGLLLTSIVFNYVTGGLLSDARVRHRKALLIAGVAINLAMIGYFKYFNFFLKTLNDLGGFELSLRAIVLPLGISFYTFQKIAYLVDCYRGLVKERNFLNYLLFVTFFPQLIAGPIVHHQEFLPQLSKPHSLTLRWNHFVPGLAFLIFGLFKKLVLADGVAPLATILFTRAAQGQTLSMLEAWVATLAYSLQIYFDFSGYSDMAIGLGIMMGVRLPFNFNSPYRAADISEFWRRWHMTLSRFLRDYVYIPLGGNRRGPSRRYLNLMLTMLIGGLWHGASWTFVVWGGLHGFYLAVHHICKHSTPRKGLIRFGFQQLTFCLVAISWIFFRADSLASARSILMSAVAAQGQNLDQLWTCSIGRVQPAMALILLWGITQFSPNSQEWVSSRHVDSRSAAAALAAMALASVACLSRASEFIYYQF